ncbi:hypothetical protein GCM10022226_15550 [Sphaerisporangium flaviroseum]|uniref:Pentapeptide repeat-containing protein n=1 Tax=Sphaerisporangium flaviroseum TaxID=509199 RepID=A0ABP7HNG2_9ACTN
MATKAAPRLLPIWLALALAALAGSLVLVTVILVGLRVLGVTDVRTEPLLTGATMFDLLKIAFAVVAGAGGVVALVMAYRRQRVGEAAELREATALFNERFATVTDKLGHAEAAVRLAGVHGLAGLADDAPTRALRQTCVDVLCAYLRVPYQSVTDDEIAGRAYREVRHTVLRCIAARLRPGSEVSWRGCDLDFSGAVFDGGDLSGAVLQEGRISFADARFVSGPRFFLDVAFIGARVGFERVAFTGDVGFSGAKFLAGTADFSGVTFTAGTASFSDTTWNEGVAVFAGVTFAGGRADFRKADGPAPSGLLVSGRRRDEVVLPEAWLSSSG